MTQVKFDISTSLDGYIAGPDPDLEQPLGAGGEQLHEWGVKLSIWREQHGLAGGEVNADNEIMAESIDGIGAYVMGRGMFGGGDGSWGDEPWSGWWGEEPPFHAPVFVVTHHGARRCRARAARPSTSSPRASRRRSRRRSRPPGRGTCCSPAAPASSSRRSGQA